MSIVDRLAELRGGYTTKTCDEQDASCGDCHGCIDFINKLKQSKEGIEILKSRFGDEWENPIMGSPRACVWRKGAQAPSAIADAGILDFDDSLSAELGVMTSPEDQKKGYANKALTVLGKKLKRDGVSWVYCDIEHDNLIAQNMALHAGLQGDFDNSFEHALFIRFTKKL